MKYRYKLIPLALCLTSAMSTAAFAAQEPTMEQYEKDGNRYIEKVYTIDTKEDISDIADSTFDLNGFTYHQIEMKNEPVIKVESKEVEKLETKSVSAQGASEILKVFGTTLEYTDEDGYKGELKPDLETVKYYASGYKTKTLTKTGSRMYYNLPTMDTSQIPKSIWQDGISMKLVDLQWIGDNRSASADTAVGNNYAAKGLYKGSYQVNVPSGYTAEVMFKGTVGKEVSEQIAYHVTYLGEEAKGSGLDIPVLPVAGIGLAGAALAGTGIYFYRKSKKAPEEEQIAEDSREADTDEES